jgi:hypothetical protein
MERSRSFKVAAIVAGLLVLLAAGTQIDYNTQIKNAPGASIVGFGAKCDGTTNNYAAVAAAIAAGNVQIYTPPNCMWIPPSGIIPGGANGISYFGGNSTTSVVKSAASPGTLGLQAQPGVTLTNMNAIANTCTYWPSGQCQVAFYYNARNVTDLVILSGRSAHQINAGSNWTVTGATNATPIVITVSTGYASYLKDGAPVFLSGIAGNTAANGYYWAKTTGYTDTTFALYTSQSLVTGVSGNGGYTSGGTASLDMAATNCRNYGAGDCYFSDSWATGTAFRGDTELGSSGAAFFIGLNGGAGPGISCQTTYDYIGNSIPTPVCMNIYDQTGVLNAILNPAGNFQTAGNIATYATAVTVTNGANNHNVSIGNRGFVRLTGATAPYTVGGILNNSIADGRQLTIMDYTGQIMTIVAMDGSAPSNERILIPNGGPYVCGHGFCIVDLIYDGSSAQWILKGAN